MALSNMTKEAWAQLDEYPLSPPPPNIVPDFEHPIWHGAPMVIVGATGISAMLIMASIRIYIKCYIKRRWEFDDSVFLFSLTCGLSLVTLHIVSMTGGAYGYHAWEVKIKDMTKAILVRALINTVGGPLLTWGVKLALYSLIFTAFRPLTYIRYMVYTGLSITLCYSAAVSIVNAIVCSPRGGTDRYAYLDGILRQQCNDPSGFRQYSIMVTGAVNVVNDLFLLILPLPACCKLQLPRKRKMGVVLVFLAGASACVMSITMLIYRYRASSFDPDRWTRDETYLQVSFLILTTVEYSVGVIIPCMASFAKFSKHMAKVARSYFITGSFQRTSSVEQEYKSERAGNNNLRKKPEPHLATIDIMLVQMFPGHTPSATSTVGGDERAHTMPIATTSSWP